MAKSTTRTEVPEAAASSGDTAASIAARRRAGRRTPTADPAAIPTGEAPAPVAGQEPVAVIASRTLVAQHTSGSPVRRTGPTWTGKPLVLETHPSGFAGVIPEDPDYVIADCDAQESMVPAGCYTPVHRTLWHRGMRVRRDLYEAVMAAHRERAESGQAHVAAPATLPAGVDGVPPEVVADAVPGEPTAGTTVPAPIVVSEPGSHVPQLP